MTQTADDPAAKAAMLQALDQLQGFAKGGLQPADRVALQDINNAQQNAGTQAYKGALANLRTQGLGGAGADEAARLSADQGAANSSASSYDQALQTALARQLSATTSAGTLAGNIRTGTQGINTQMAQIANDFNTKVQNLRTDAAKNAAANANTSATFNLENKQGITNANVATGNQNLDRANTLSQQDFTNQSTKAAGVANALGGQATQASATQAADSKQALGADQSSLAAANAVLGAFKPTGTGGTSLAGNVGNGLSTAYNTLFGSSGGNVSAANGGGTVTDALGNLVDQGEELFA